MVGRDTAIFRLIVLACDGSNRKSNADWFPAKLSWIEVCNGLICSIQSYATPWSGAQGRWWQGAELRVQLMVAGFSGCSAGPASTASASLLGECTNVMAEGGHVRGSPQAAFALHGIWWRGATTTGRADHIEFVHTHCICKLQRQSYSDICESVLHIQGRI
jgi:hypothetical protein